MLETILGVLTSAGMGVITGVLGTAVQLFFQLKQKQLDLQILDKKQAFELAMRDKDAKIHAAEWKSRTEIAAIDGEALVGAEDAKAFAASLDMEPKKYSEGVRLGFPNTWYGRWLKTLSSFLMVLIDAFRGLMRPGMTTYAMVLVTLMYWQLVELLEMYGANAWTPEEIVPIVRHIVHSVVYMAITFGTWWFGTRNKQSAPVLPERNS